MKLKKLSDTQRMVYEYNNPTNILDDDMFFKWLKEFSSKYPNFSDSHVFYPNEINLSEKSKNQTNLSTFDMLQIFKIKDFYLSLNDFCFKRGIRPNINENSEIYYYCFNIDKIPFKIGVEEKKKDNKSNEYLTEYWIERLDIYEDSFDDERFLNLNKIIEIDSKPKKEDSVKEFVKKIIRKI